MDKHAERIDTILRNLAVPLPSAQNPRLSWFLLVLLEKYDLDDNRHIPTIASLSGARKNVDGAG
jgi:hypothetical protein